MSNTAVGNVYKLIIDDVIDSARVDFEESGVDEVILNMLRQGWETKLTSLKVASFPWDPVPTPPAPAPAVAPAPTPAPALSRQAHQNVNQAYTQAQLSPTPNPQVLPGGIPGPPNNQYINNGGQQIKHEPGTTNEPSIKQEPGLPNGPIPPAYSGAPSGYGIPHGIAQQRAVSNISKQYGQHAAASIQALNGGYARTGQAQGQPLVQAQTQAQTQAQAQPPPRPSPAGQPNQAQRPTSAQYQHQQYQQQQAAASKAQIQHLQQQQQHAGQGPQTNAQNGYNPSQVDGAADEFEGVLMGRGADGKVSELGRVEIDRMLHNQIAARAKQMEGGGLMLPLKEATKHSSAHAQKSTTGLTQFDGIDDDGIKEEDDLTPVLPEHDEDAINSELDDPDDDDRQDESEEDAMGHIMLCMYDKVQRVKNKWKCTLKDGVLSVGGKDYVFHKATGEYEW